MPTNLIHVAAVSINQIPLDWRGNLERLVTALHNLKLAGVSLAVFPELCTTGYGCEDMFYSAHTCDMALKILKKILPETQGIAAVLGLPLFHRGALFNCAVVVGGGQILGVRPKTLLPKEGVHYEPRWFMPGRVGERDFIKIGDQQIPFGDYRFQFQDFCLAIEICEEAWQLKSSTWKHVDQGATIVANPSASHFAFGKLHTRQAMISERSRAMGVHYIHANLLGLEAGRCIYDGANLVGSQGKIVAAAKPLGFCDSYLTTALLELAPLHGQRLKNRIDAVTEDRSQPFREHSIDCRHILLSHAPSTLTHKVAKLVDVEPRSKNQEFLEAQMLGLFDYWRKSRAHGFTLSLSGGCDSSTIAVLVAHMVAAALQELGPEVFARRTSTPVPTSEPQSPKAWIMQILTTVYQSTSNSGEVTRDAARSLATEIGCRHFEVDLQSAVDVFVDRASSCIGRKLDWSCDDIALQNIQARTRAPMVWLLANLNKSLVLATSNRSEVAVGYATMDGDTAGGLAPLGGIDKDFLRQWLLWAERDCRAGLGPVRSLQKVTVQSPTAELRPPHHGQEDEKDLMPYQILNRIEQLFLRDLLGPEDIMHALVRDFTLIPASTLRDYVSRFLNLWNQNQWKRERFAPSFMMDDISLDPKTWCRYPILSATWSQDL